jgi:hypothetical protein
MCKITSYINPKWPDRVYYKATYGNESYHHIDRAIVECWLAHQIVDSELKIEKDRINQKAIDAFYKK